MCSLKRLALRSLPRGFHSDLQTTRPDEAKNTRGRVLVAIGAGDPSISVEQRDRVEDGQTLQKICREQLD